MSKSDWLKPDETVVFQDRQRVTRSIFIGLFVAPLLATLLAVSFFIGTWERILDSFALFAVLLVAGWGLGFLCSYKRIRVILTCDRLLRIQGLIEPRMREVALSDIEKVVSSKSKNSSLKSLELFLPDYKVVVIKDIPNLGRLHEALAKMGVAA